MVFNGVVVVTVAHLSADTWQEIRRIPVSDRVTSQQLLDMVCCLPLHQLGRFALCLWTFLCLPPPDSFYSYSYYSSSSSDYDDDDEHDGNYGYDDDDDDDDEDGSSSSTSSTVQIDDSYYHLHSD